MCAASENRVSSVDLDTLVSHLDDYLEVGSSGDYCPNGLQVQGRAVVSRVISGVSACRELFELACRHEADAVLVHHGLFWRGAPRTLTGIQYQRVAELIRNDLSLLAYHLPLDRHPEVGNNAVAVKRLGLTDPQPFGELEGQPIGVCGRFDPPRPRAAVLEQLENLYQQEPLAFSFGNEAIASVAVVSGGGSRFFEAAIAAGIDLFVTGEPEEWSMNLAREAGANFVAGGHHATERLGVQALGDYLRRTFDLAVDFVDIPNPV